MEKGDLLYITKRKGNEPGVIMAYEKSYTGNEDLSLHGSPMYEDFIVCTNLKTGDRKSFGSQTYHWCDPIGRIKKLQDALWKIRNLAQFA